MVKDTFLLTILTYRQLPLWVNDAPSDVNTTLDGSAYPGWKMFRFSSLYLFFLEMKKEQAISGTSAAT